mgnify:CR=1 FL=1
MEVYTMSAKDNYTIEFATTEDFAFSNRAGFTTGSVNDANIKKMYGALVAAVKAGAITPVEPDSDEFTAIPVFMRVRRSNSDNAVAPVIPGVELGDTDLI